jgi:hypothetical protein
VGVWLKNKRDPLKNKRDPEASSGSGRVTDEEMFGVAAPAVGPWQRQLNELGGVKPLAFGQYGELGPGFVDC